MKNKNGRSAINFSVTVRVPTEDAANKIKKFTRVINLKLKHTGILDDKHFKDVTFQK